ncbi:hypothetical protein DFS33DRAFT_1457463 [Desarmillaria ectypa]|nr:hypothetical protein DFS33DRAFT_1457463 [Desarmillaria ectypa]
MAHWESRLDVLATAAENGQKLLKTCLGSHCFDDNGLHVGSETVTEMLRLCPGDNLNQCTWLGPLCRLECYSDALYFARLWMEDLLVDRQVYVPPYRGGTAFKAPEPKLFSPEVEKEVDLSPCSMSYAAALAAFKLWGDCEESRQYLRIASKANPHVMVKVLGRIKYPDLWMKMMSGIGPMSILMPKERLFKKYGKPSCTLKETRAAEFQWCLSYCQYHKMKKAAVQAFSAGKAAPEGSTITIFATDFSGGAVHLYDGAGDCQWCADPKPQQYGFSFEEEEK